MAATTRGPTRGGGYTEAPHGSAHHRLAGVRRRCVLYDLLKRFPSRHFGAPTNEPRTQFEHASKFDDFASGLLAVSPVLFLPGSSGWGRRVVRAFVDPASRRGAVATATFSFLASTRVCPLSSSPREIFFGGLILIADKAFFWLPSWPPQSSARGMDVAHRRLHHRSVGERPAPRVCCSFSDRRSQSVSWRGASRLALFASGASYVATTAAWPRLHHPRSIPQAALHRSSEVARRRPRLRNAPRRCMITAPSMLPSRETPIVALLSLAP
mmetsp:Transcript_48289/g.148969  ORF Transcript_48289/g.148969 Transcript_48289/m.148969 type:complete len:269 (+) Transcript_48289:994-1800(+)